MLERPPRDDLRMQRFVFRLLRSGVILAGIGAGAIVAVALLFDQPLPRGARGWAAAIGGWVVLRVVYGVYDRVLGRAFNTEQDGWEQRYRERRDATIEQPSERRRRRFGRPRARQLPPDA